MYKAFYGLEKKPFNMTPDPAFLYLTKQHREALAGLTYAILDRKGFLVLSGVAGCGKTTLLAWVLQRLPVENVQSAVILNPTLTREEFLEMTMLDFGITDIPQSKARRLWQLQHFLLEGKRQGKVNVLIVDEAHKLSVELLEEIRLLGNLEQEDEKLIQILLIGQRELDAVMNQPELWQLKQRVSVRLAIDALSVEEVEYYMKHRWTVAGGKLPLPFTPTAITAICQRSGGIPRLINSLCDNTLTLAFADEARIVQASHVEMAARDLQLPSKGVSVQPVIAEPQTTVAPKATALATPATNGTTNHASPVSHAVPVSHATRTAPPPYVPSAPHAAPGSKVGVAKRPAMTSIVSDPEPEPHSPSLFARWMAWFRTNGDSKY